MRKETTIVTITCDLCEEVTENAVKRIDVSTGVKFREERGEPSFRVTLGHFAFDPDICPVCAENILLDAISRVRKMQVVEAEAQQ